MEQRLLRRAAIGLCCFVSFATVGPTAAVADTPRPPTPGTTTSEPTDAGSARAGPSAAQPSTSTSYALNSGPFAITVSPTRLVVGQADIGTTQQLLLINRGQEPVTAEVQKRNFVTGLDGHLGYQQNAPYAAANWVTVAPTSIRLAPGATQVVTVDVRAPRSPEPGDHQVAILFLVPAGKTQANIRINRGIAVPVFITVPGPVDDSVSLSDFHAPEFALWGPVTLTATMRNTGTVHRDFRGTTPLTVDGAGTAKPFPDFTISRGAVRDISTTWNPPFLCVCHPSVRYANDRQAYQTQTVRVIVFPWPWFAAALGAVLLVLILGRLARRHYRAQVVAAVALHNAASEGDV